jgi:CBS domain-containing protein
MATVKDIMTEKPLTISKDATLQEAAKIMKARKFGSLLVKNAKEVVGILTEMDIVQKSVAIDRPPETTKVEAAMSIPLLTIKAGSSILDATDLMAERFIRHLAVTENEGIIGIVSIRDVLQSEELPWVSVRRLMSQSLFMVTREANVRDAAKLMRHNKIGSLLVSGRRRRPRTKSFFTGDGKEITGIITETDIVRKVVAAGLNPLTTTAEKVMTRSLTAINAWKRAAKACELMAKNRIRHLPVTEEGQKIVGMLSVRDLINPLYYAHGGVLDEQEYSR